MSTVENTVAAGAETPANLSNDKRLSDLKKQVTKLGAEASLGKDSLPKLAHAVVQAATDGLIDATSKDAKGNDAAFVIYEAYASGESSKAIHEMSDGGKKANVSKLRQLISMGCMTTIDPVNVMNTAFEARKAMVADSHKVKSSYPFYIDIAREQLKTDKELTKSEMEHIAIKDEPASKELEKELARILKTLEGLVTGDNKDKLRDKDERVEAAMHAIKERLGDLTKAKATMVLRQQAAKLGLQLA